MALAACPPVFVASAAVATRRQAWVYVDHLIFDQVAHDAQGNLIFQLPGIIRKPTMVEVITPPPGQASSEE